MVHSKFKYQKDVAMFNFSYTADSIQGKHRSVNKDCHGFFERDNAEFLVTVLDGVSSEANAKHGVRMAYRYIEKEFKNKRKAIDLRDILYNASEKLRLSKYKGPYTTACLMYINFSESPYVQFCSIGDTRGYVILGHHIKQITEDHALQSPKNVLTHYLGMESIEYKDIYISSKLQGDCFLVCTDGFYSIMEKSIPKFHAIFTDIKIKNFSKQIREIILGNNSDDATYAVVRLKNV